MDDVVVFIETLKGLDSRIEHACLHGSCYKLHLLLAQVYSDAVPYMNTERDHVVTRVGNSLYDITGRVGSIAGKQANNYHRMDEVERRVASKW